MAKYFYPDAAEWKPDFWARSYVWEKDESNEWALWSQDSQENHDRCLLARGIQESDPEAGFLILRELADAGSIWPMELTAECYVYGHGVTADPERAKGYYRRAISAGSQMALIEYANFLWRLGEHDEWPRVLENGIEQDFASAYYWMAELRLKQSRRRKACQEVQPLLEYAADKGHPGAKLNLARMMLNGKLGLGKILQGRRLLLECSTSHLRAFEADLEEANSAEPDQSI